MRTVASRSNSHTWEVQPGLLWSFSSSTRLETKLQEELGQWASGDNVAFLFLLVPESMLKSSFRCNRYSSGMKCFGLSFAILPHFDSLCTGASRLGSSYQSVLISGTTTRTILFPYLLPHHAPKRMRPLLRFPNVPFLATVLTRFWEKNKTSVFQYFIECV